MNTNSDKLSSLEHNFSVPDPVLIAAESLINGQISQGYEHISADSMNHPVKSSCFDPAINFNSYANPLSNPSGSKGSEHQDNYQVSHAVRLVNKFQQPFDVYSTNGINSFGEKVSSSVSGSEELSHPYPVCNINFEMKNTFSTFARIGAHHQANEGQEASERPKMNQRNEKSQESLSDQKFLLLQIRIEKLMDDYRKKGQTENQMSCVFGDRKFPTKEDKEKILLRNKVENCDEIHVKAIQSMENDVFSSLMLELKTAFQSLANSIEEGDILNQILCYESFLKEFFWTENQNHIRYFLGKALDLVGILQKTQLEEFPNFFLVLNTLGVSCYKLSDLERASQLLSKGLEIAKDVEEKAILLNNLACILSMNEANQQEGRKTFQEAYNFAEKQIESFSYKAFQKWSSLQVFNVRPTDIISIRNCQLNRSSEFILLADKKISQGWKEPINDKMDLSFVIFQNYCWNKAQNMLSFLKNQPDGSLFENVGEISYSLSLRKSAYLRFNFELEVLLNLFKIATIFQAPEGNFQQERLFQEARDLIERKEELIRLYENNKIDLFVKVLDKFELLFVIAGL